MGWDCSFCYTLDHHHHQEGIIIGPAWEINTLYIYTHILGCVTQSYKQLLLYMSIKVQLSVRASICIYMHTSKYSHSDYTVTCLCVKHMHLLVSSSPRRYALVLNLLCTCGRDHWVACTNGEVEGVQTGSARVVVTVTRALGVTVWSSIVITSLFFSVIGKCKIWLFYSLSYTKRGKKGLYHK